MKSNSKVCSTRGIVSNLNYELRKSGRKYSAICLFCKRVLSNTTTGRLETHRKKCVKKLEGGYISTDEEGNYPHDKRNVCKLDTEEIDPDTNEEQNNHDSNPFNITEMKQEEDVYHIEQKTDDDEVDSILGSNQNTCTIEFVSSQSPKELPASPSKNIKIAKKRKTEGPTSTSIQKTSTKQKKVSTNGSLLIEAPIDDDTIFCNFILSEIRSLNSTWLKSRLKIKIQKAILEIREQDMNLQGTSSK